MDETTLQTRLRQAEDCIKFLNENPDAWQRLREVSDSRLMIYDNGMTYCFPGFPRTLVSSANLLQQYQEYKRYLNAWNEGNPVYSEYWLPMSANYVEEEAYIDLASPELPILVACWKFNEHIVKTACPSLLKFVEKDYLCLQKEGKGKDTADVSTINQTMSVAGRTNDKKQIKAKKSFWKLFSFWKKKQATNEEKKKVTEEDLAKYERLEGNHNLLLVGICAKYLSSLRGVSVWGDQPNLNSLLRGLPDLKLDENYVLDNYRPHPKSPFSQSIGQYLCLYVRLKSVDKPRDMDFGVWTLESELKRQYENKPKVLKAKLKELYSQMKPLPECEDPFKHITLPFTEEAIWQAYLLKQVGHQIGMWWHGLYNERIFINRKEDINGLRLYLAEDYKRRLEQFKIKAKASWSETMCPMVILDDDKAYISHYWFDYWNGLRQVKCLVSYDSHSQKITDFLIKESNAIVRYDCKIMF